MTGNEAVLRIERTPLSFPQYPNQKPTSMGAALGIFVIDAEGLQFSHSPVKTIRFLQTSASLRLFLFHCVTFLLLMMQAHAAQRFPVLTCRAQSSRPGKDCYFFRHVREFDSDIPIAAIEAVR